MKSFTEELEEQGKLEFDQIEAKPIITRFDLLKQPSQEVTEEEAKTIWPILIKSLPLEIGYGLAAVQIGISKKVGLVTYNGKSYKLLNTKLLSGSNPIRVYNEGCLSIPGKLVNTERFSEITIQDDVLGKVVLTEKADGMLPFILQHEIDHFEGITILDRQLKPFVREFHYNRNDKCPECGKKLKKCEHSDKYLLQ